MFDNVKTISSRLHYGLTELIGRRQRKTRFETFGNYDHLWFIFEGQFSFQKSKRRKMPIKYKELNVL